MTISTQAILNYIFKFDRHEGVFITEHRELISELEADSLNGIGYVIDRESAPGCVRIWTPAGYKQLMRSKEELAAKLRPTKQTTKKPTMNEFNKALLARILR